MKISVAIYTIVVKKCKWYQQIYKHVQTLCLNIAKSKHCFGLIFYFHFKNTILTYTCRCYSKIIWGVLP